MIKLILLIVGLMLLIGASSATVSYSSNTIWLDNGTNNLSSIYSDLSNSSLLSFDVGNNTYTLSANISGKNFVSANLSLEDSILIINSSASDSYYIKSCSHLIINNITIKPTNYSHTWNIHAFGRGTTWYPYSVSINLSDISGGYIYVAPNGLDDLPSEGATIYNNVFHDYTSSNGNYGILSFNNNAATNATIYNNTFNDIHMTAGSYGKIIGLCGYGGSNIEKIYFNNCSVNSYGMVYFYGGTNASVSDFTITDCTGDAICGKEYGGYPIFKNGTVTNISGYGIRYYLDPVYGNVSAKLLNVTIDGADTGIYVNDGNIEMDIYNITINDTTTVMNIRRDSVAYLTNTKFTNYSTLYTIYNTGNIREYFLTDISVEDTTGNPINGSTITITSNTSQTYSVINRDIDALMSVDTLSNGHTPLPNQSSSSTLALLYSFTNITNTVYYNYTISVDANEYNINNSVIITPDLSWYRTNSNQYQNTTNVILTDWVYNSNNTYDNQTCTYYPDGSRTCTAPIENDVVVFTNNIHPVIT